MYERYKMEVKLIEDSDGQLVLPLDPDTLKQMGWDIGDQLEWEFDDVSATIRKKED